MAETAARKARPQYRNIGISQLMSYRLPPAGIVSILHRISGALLFLVGIPFSLYLLQQSITSEISFESYRAIALSVEDAGPTTSPVPLPAPPPPITTFPVNAGDHV